jgi:hypothetical protein
MLIGAVLAMNLVLALDAYQTPAIAADCNSADGVLSTCKDNVKDGVKNVFRSNSDPEREKATSDANKNCVQCAQDYIDAKLKEFNPTSTTSEK